MAQRFRKKPKPVVIEAVRFTGDNHDQCIRFVGEAAKITGRERALGIVTLEGLMNVAPGDWIIKGVQGEFYPCKPDIFDATYETVYDLEGEQDGNGQ